MDSMSSRQRLLSAINHSGVDHVPLCFKWWSRPYLSDKSDGWKDQFERITKTTALGLDDTVAIEPPRTFSQDVSIRVKKETRPGERYPTILKEYRTPKGTLKQVACQTDDWTHGDDIPIFTDFVVPRHRSKKYLIENIGDVEALSCLFSGPTQQQVREFQKEVAMTKRFAEEKGILVESGAAFGPPWHDGSGLFLGDALAWLCGIENAILMAYRRPDVLHRLLDVILEWNLRYLRLVSEAGGSDMVTHRGWYESFWSPQLYRTFIVPRMRKEIELVHRADSKFCYILTTGIMPLLDLIKEMGVDVLFGVDPVQGGADLRRVKDRIGDKVCIWGGVNAAVTLGSRNKENVEEAVTEAMRILAPGGGFILSAVDQLFEDTRWDNALTMIETWRKLSQART